MQSKNTTKLDINNISTIYNQLTPIRLRKYSTIIWSSLMLVLTVIDVSLKLIYNLRDGIPAVMLVGIIGILLPVVYRWAPIKFSKVFSAIHIIIDLSDEELDNWSLDNARRALSATWKTWLSGLFIVGLGSATLIALDSQLSNIDLIFILLKIPLFFFCGIGAYGTIVGISAPLRLKELPLRIPLYHDKYSEISGINSIVLKQSLLGLAVYVILISAMYINTDGKFNMIFLAWAIFVGILSLVFFPTTIWGLHVIMRDAKRGTVRLISHQIDNALGKNVRRPTQKSLDYLKSLFSLRNELDKLPEWPIDLTTFFALVTPAISTIIAVLSFLRK